MLYVLRNIWKKQTNVKHEAPGTRYQNIKHHQLSSTGTAYISNVRSGNSLKYKTSNIKYQMSNIKYQIPLVSNSWCQKHRVQNVESDDWSSLTRMPPCDQGTTVSPPQATWDIRQYTENIKNTKDDNIKLPGTWYRISSAKHEKIKPSITFTYQPCNTRIHYIYIYICI